MMRAIVLAIPIAILTLPAWPRDNEILGELAKARALYENGVQKINAERNERLKALTQRYIEDLQKIQDAYTRQADLQGALATKKEIDRLKAMLADGELPPSGTAQPSPSGEPPSYDSPTEGNLPRELAARLVLHLRFDDDDKDRTRDSSGKRNHGKTFNVEYAQGRIGKACALDGRTSWVQIPASRSLKLGQTFSASVWVFPYRRSGRHGRVLVKGDASDFDFAMQVYPNGGPQVVFVDEAGKWWNTGRTPEANSIPVRKWTHFVTVYDGRLLSVYLNGILVLTLDAQTAGPRQSNRPLNLGRFGGNGRWAYDFKGMIDEAMIFDKPLSAEEVKRVYDLQRHDRVDQRRDGVMIGLRGRYGAF